MYHIRLYHLFICVFFILSSCKKDQPNKVSNNFTNQNNSSNYLFEKISSDKSGITFNNQIKHDLTSKSNLFDYDYFYNGSGVATGDLNNDGLLDIVFTANQAENKIYINKGDLVFEDITNKSNFNQGKNWSSGVTLADVNNDGWLDIYISQGGPFQSTERKNLLFINQKDLTFKEEAKTYGLDDGGISTQSAFFDFDKDGDLDCIVMNESEYYGYDPATFYKINKDKKILKKNSSHFYENRNGKFHDITEKAGLLKPSFGLGLVIADINNDNWPDIYMANDYYVPDAMYINNKNGTFSDNIKNATKQVSFYGMGADIADINNDNKDDIFVLDMAAQDHVRSKTLMASMNVSQFELLKSLGLQTQYMYNSLQLNMGNNQYHNIGQYLGLSKTDWSWAGLIFDVDNDENEDIYVTNGYRRYALDNDSRLKIQRVKRQYQGKVPIEIKEQIYNDLPSEKISNILFRNKGSLSFENSTSTSGLNEASFSNGAAYADLDNDGDLDIVVNNMDSNAFLYKNLSSDNNSNHYLKVIPKGNLSESFAKVQISYNNRTKTKESRRVRGYLSAVDNSLYFGLGKNNKIDTVKVSWPSGKYQEFYNVDANTTLTVLEKDAQNSKLNKQVSYSSKFSKKNKMKFSHKENSFNDFNKEVLLPYKQSTLGPFIAKGDVNGDQLEDIYIGGAKNQPGQLFINTSNGYQKKNNAVFVNDAMYEDMESVFFDLDNDNDLDLYITSGGSEFNKNDVLLKDRLYINDGKGNFVKHSLASIDELTYSGKTVTKIDFDKDGDDDLIVGNRIVPQHYPFSQPSIVFENDKGTFKNVTNKVCGDLNDFGIINKIITTDIDNDGWEDFIAVGEWTHIGIFKNKKGVFKDISKSSKLDVEKGWWFSVIETDLNNDGLKDFIVGNVGTNTKYKAKPDKPLRVYADDFDLNGTHDVVLSYKYNDTFVPLRGKECSTQQMPFISQKIPSFQQFANSSLEDIYGDKIHNAYQKEVNQFKSLVLLNTGNGVFKKMALPPLAQTIPIIDGDVLDYNGDGFEDVIIVGNIYNTEVETPRLDNSFALILESNTKDGYNVIHPETSGLYTEGNVKSVKVLNSAKTEVIIGVNNGDAMSFELKK